MNHDINKGPPVFRSPLTTLHSNAIPPPPPPVTTKHDEAVQTNASRSSISSGAPQFITMQASRTSVLRRQSSGVVGQQTLLDVGNVVEVPGGMMGTVRYIGSVKGKNGMFAGVELTEEWSARGKNDGDVDGISYFTTSIPGSGIFLPTSRAIKVDSGATTTTTAADQTPVTPVARKFSSHIDTPTPALRSFSQSVGPGSRPPFSQSIGPGARPPSPQSRLKSRPSLPRPASPTRKTAPSPVRPNGTGAYRGAPSPAPQRNGKVSTPVPNRAQSRAQSRLGEREEGVGRPTVGARVPSTSVGKLEETRKLQKELEERDKRLDEQAQQLREQSEALVELEATLTSMQSSNNKQNKPHARRSTSNFSSTDSAEELTHLRTQVVEKSDRISVLTREFDAHRHDFRDTIDALEAASTETERVYQKQVQELQQEVDELRQQRQEIEMVAEQFESLEALVQELEVGLEEARSGEEKARRRCEKLEKEVERLVVELRDARSGGEELGKPTILESSKILAEKDYEIRGLQAIIHSLDSSTLKSSTSPLPKQQPHTDTSSIHTDTSSIHTEELTTLRAALATKTARESSLLSELRLLRQQQQPNSSPPRTQHHQTPSPTLNTPNKRLSGTFNSMASTTSAVGLFPRDHESLKNFLQNSPRFGRLEEQQRARSSDDEEEEDEEEAGRPGLWCEICEVEGHDVLGCNGVIEAGEGRNGGGGLGFELGSGKERWRGDYGEADEVETPAAEDQEGGDGYDAHGGGGYSWHHDAAQDSTPPSPTPAGNAWAPTARGVYSSPPPPLSSTTTTTTVPPTSTPSAREISAEAKIEPKLEAEKEATMEAIPGETGPAPGKRSGRVDVGKWCAFCERDGHDSVDCPFEEEL